MRTYRNAYLDDHDIHVLNRVTGINSTGHDSHGRDQAVGRYVANMAMHRHCTLTHFRDGYMLLTQAREDLAPTSNPQFWERFGGPVAGQADLLAAERQRYLADIDAALEVMRTGLATATEPGVEPGDDDEPDRGAAVASAAAFAAFIQQRTGSVAATPAGGGVGVESIPGG